jgi:hypothetical protein
MEKGELPELTFSEIIGRIHDLRALSVREGLERAHAEGREPSSKVNELSERWARHELTDKEYIDAVYATLGFVGPQPSGSRIVIWQYGLNV